MATQVGSIDSRRRPVVRIERDEGDDDLLCLLDTGFNGELFIAIDDAKRLGITLRPGLSTAQLASGASVRVQRGVVVIRWLGVPRRVEVLAADAKDAAPARGDDPIALVGTALLSPHLVLLDFAAGTIEIEAER